MHRERSATLDAMPRVGHNCDISLCEPRDAPADEAGRVGVCVLAAVGRWFGKGQDSSVATVESSADSQSRYERLEARLELIAVVLLGLAATATAWAAFQGGQYDGQMLTAFTE